MRPEQPTLDRKPSRPIEHFLHMAGQGWTQVPLSEIATHDQHGTWVSFEHEVGQPPQATVQIANGNEKRKKSGPDHVIVVNRNGAHGPLHITAKDQDHLAHIAHTLSAVRMALQMG